MPTAHMQLALAHFSNVATNRVHILSTMPADIATTLLRYRPITPMVSKDLLHRGYLLRHTTRAIRARGGAA